MNGIDDKIVNTKGMLGINKTNGGDVIGWAPIEYSAWYFASLNQKQPPDFKTRIDEFKKVETYTNQVENSSINCYQITNPDGSPLLANITVCNGTGGHIYWRTQKLVI